MSRLAGLPNADVLTDARCEGLFADNWLAIVQDRRLYKLRADRVVLATGALEQPVVFRNNDLPGVMFGSAAQRLIRLYGVRPGNRAVVLTANDYGYGVVLDLLMPVSTVAAVIDLRPHQSRWFALRRFWRGTVRVESGDGGDRGARPPSAARGSRCEDCKRTADASDPIETIGCDLLCVSAGFAPNLALAGHLGARLRLRCRKPRCIAPRACRRRRDRRRRKPDLQSRCRARRWRRRSGRATKPPAHRPADANAVSHPWPIYPHRKGKDFVDFDEDLTVADIEDTVASGFEDIQLIKRYSTAGMGPSQGQHSAANTIRLAARMQARAESG